jgi:hypothetical protein
MYYYSVNYKTVPSTLSPELQKEIGNDYETIFLFGHQNKLNNKEIKYALESYLNDNKLNYTELIITHRKEISEEEYASSTQYS